MIGIGEIVLNISVFTFINSFKEKSSTDIKNAEEIQSSKIDCQQTLSLILINFGLTTFISNKKNEVENYISFSEMIIAYLYISYIITRCITKFENILINGNDKKNKQII